MSASVNRYSDTELLEFQDLINKKLEKTKRQLEDLVEQILEMTENNDSDYGIDYFDDSNTSSNLEMLNSMAIHQRKYVQELENALLRIRNKTYGICSVTGELIDKRRLIAVPTTTKSLVAKTGQERLAESEAPPVVNDSEEDEDEAPKSKKKKKEPVIITKVIRRTSTNPKPAPAEDHDEDFYLNEDEIYLDDEDNEEDISLDGLEDVIEDDSQPLDY